MKKRYFKILFTALLIVSRLTVAAQPEISLVTVDGAEYVRYGRIDFTITVNAAFDNPYRSNDISVDMVALSPSGELITLPCYFESGTSPASQWKARFAPREAGAYEVHFDLGKDGLTVFSTEAQTITVADSDSDGFLTPHDNWTFRFDSGKPFRGIGENIGWESRVWENDKYNYEYLVGRLAANGGNFFRTWMSAWNLPVEWNTVVDTKRYANSAEYYHPQGIARMDELVTLCEDLDVKIMLTFDWHGGLQTGDRWNINPYNVANGGPAATPTEFFTSAEARARYKDRLRYIVARWGYSTSIGAWEFFNEIDNAAYNGTESSLAIPLTAIAEWHDEMSAYLKSIDPYDHVVTTSISHRELSGLFDVENIDLTQRHIYRNTTSLPGAIDEMNMRYGKPFVVGEFGYDWDWNNINESIGPQLDYDFKRGLWYGLFSPTPVMPMTWWWEFFDDRGTIEYFASVREIGDMMLESGEGNFQQLVMPAVGSGIQSYGVKCGDKYFVYLLNNTDKPVADKRVLVPVSGASFFEIKAFFPETREWSAPVVRSRPDNRITAGSFSFEPYESLILVLTPDDGPITSVTPEERRSDLYPNPARGPFTVNLTSKAASVRVINPQGSTVVKYENIAAGELRMDALDAGVYNIVITYINGHKEFIRYIQLH